MTRSDLCYGKISLMAETRWGWKEEGWRLYRWAQGREGGGTGEKSSSQISQGWGDLGGEPGTEICQNVAFTGELGWG